MPLSHALEDNSKARALDSKGVFVQWDNSGWDIPKNGRNRGRNTSSTRVLSIGEWQTDVIIGEIVQDFPGVNDSILSFTPALEWLDLQQLESLPIS